MRTIYNVLLFLLSIHFLFTAAHATVATQSSTGWEGDANRAIDGNTDGNYWNHSVTHTGGSTFYDWLLIDLESVQSIDTLTIWNRTDCCGERIDQTAVMVSDTPFNPQATRNGMENARRNADWKRQINYTPNQEKYTFDLGGISGRYILIQKVGYSDSRRFLSIAEVEIMRSNASLISNNPRDFTKIDIAGQSSTNIYGDLMLIGNQSLCWKGLTYNGRRRVGRETSQCQNPPFDASNNFYFQRHANLDPIAVSAGYLNSTSADLTISPDDRVVEAWLFVIGRLYTNNQVERASAQNVRLKTPTSGGYVSLRADDDKFNWMVDGPIFDYGLAINVTQYVQQSGRYWVADLKATEMLNQGSGWGIAVIVEDTTRQNRTLKNISLYNGFNGVYSEGNYPATVTSHISGFFTPRTDTVKSNLIVMAGESDRALSDSMRITKKDGTEVDIKDSLNDTQNVQNGTISKNGSNVTTRNPGYANTLGIDIDIIDASDIIDNEQTSTEITIDSFGDRIFLSMYGFATELYIPELCYDYNIQKNGFSLKADENRSFTTNGLGEIKAHISIRSKEGDFDLKNSKLKFYAEPYDALSFISAKYSPNTVNTLIPAITTAQHTSLKPEIAIGENATPEGGTIGIFERYFAQYYFTIRENKSNTIHFDIDLNTSIDFGSGPVEFILSSKNNTLPRCEQNLTYSPLLGAFNIERTDSGAYNSVTQPQRRYPLYTQVSNKPFDISVVAYDANVSPVYQQELILPQDCVVEIELIDSSPYNDKNSFFKCENTQESIIQTLPNGEESLLVKLKQGTSRTKLENSISTQNALWNAAFRIWYYTDPHGSLILHDCENKTDGRCFRTKIYENIKGNNSTDFCESDCSPANDSADSCYKCLRKFYATPVCSRDNFAIKPASYRIGIYDNNESSNTTTSKQRLSENLNTPSATSIAAGYRYRLEAIATQFGNNDKTNGYTTLFTTPSNIDKKSTALFNSSTGTACADTNNTDWGVWFENGAVKETISGRRINLQSNNLVSLPNTGAYDYHIEDLNWTIVDQSRYVDKDGNKLKTFPDVDDCITSGNKKYSIANDNNGLSGCGITSNISYNGAPNTYEDLPLFVWPYRFDLSSITLNTLPQTGRNYAFMNDYTHSYYSDPVLHPIDTGTAFIGSLAALNKQGGQTTNFTKGCTATDITLHINRTSTPFEGNIKDSAGNPVAFQQYLQESNISTAPIAAHTLNSDENLTLHATAFEDGYQGYAHIRLHSNFQKPLNETVNPINMHYKQLQAYATAAGSFAHMGRHIPKGSNNYDNNITYYFAKVTPEQTYYPNVTNNYKLTPIYVDIFCDLGTECNSSFNLNTPTKGKDDTLYWYSATMFDPLTDGTTDLSVRTFKGIAASPHVTPANSVRFIHAPAARNDVNVSVAGPGRPTTVEVNINPVPWLLYDETDPNGQPSYKVKFIGAPTWQGVGNTGNTAELGSSTHSNTRMNW